MSLLLHRHEDDQSDQHIDSIARFTAALPGFPTYSPTSGQILSLVYIHHWLSRVGHQCRHRRSPLEKFDHEKSEESVDVDRPGYVSVLRSLNRDKKFVLSLALSDLLFNLALLIRGTHDTVLKRTGRSCSVISFLSHLAEVLSAWYTVSFTIQRFVAVHYPFQAAARDHSSRLISLLLVFLVSVSFCFSLTYYAQYVDCTEELTLGWFIADAALSFVIPFALILLFNILINISIRKHLRSPISVHAILLRRRSPAKNIFQTLHRDETCSTENNTCTMANITLIHSEDTENIEMRFTNRELKASVELDCQARRVSIVSVSTSLLFLLLFFSSCLSDGTQ